MISSFCRHLGPPILLTLSLKTITYAQDVQVPSFLSLTQFSGILETESLVEFDYASGVDAAENYWAKSIYFEWTRAFDEEETNEGDYPFMICHANRRLSGVQRRGEIESAINKLDIPMARLIPIYNEDDKTCFVTKLRASLAIKLANYLQNAQLYIFPLTYAMKLIGNSVSSAQEQGDGGYLDVTLCPGDLVNLTDVNTKQQEELNTLVLDAITSKDLFTSKTEAYENFFWFALLETQGLGEEIPRSKFWKEKFDAGVDSSTPICDRIAEELVFDFYKAGRNEGDLSVMSIRFDQLDRNTAVADPCILALVIAVSLLPSTCAIQSRPRIENQNRNAQYLIQTRPGAQPGIPWYNTSISGRGQYVALSDTGIDINNCYFWDNSPAGQKFVKRRENIDTNQRKVIQYDPYVDTTDYNYGHGTHCAGTIVGHKSVDGINEQVGMADGIARDAKVAFIDIGTMERQLILPPPDRLYNTGHPHAKVHSASWGSAFNGYGINARNMDSFMYDSKEFLIVTAAGNGGSGNTANSVGDPGTAKNVITVGASNSAGQDLMDGQLGSDYIASFSARGPTADGRTKPDILAPGSYILSAGARTSFTDECDPEDGIYVGAGKFKAGVLSLQGTSMATAVVSGAAILVRQYFEDGYYPSGVKNLAHSYVPLASLIKAVILNGGALLKDVDNGQAGTTPSTPYDNTQNYGRVNLEDSLYLEGTKSVQAVLYDREKLFDGEELKFSGTVKYTESCNPGTKFSATLAWTDPPATGGCKSCVLNDLDMFVTKNNFTATKYFPNGLGGKDALNNVERVQLDFNEGDNYTVHIYGYNLVTDFQVFSLAITGCVGIPTKPLVVPSETTTPTSTNGTAMDDTRMYIIMDYLVWGAWDAVACVALALLRLEDEHNNNNCT
eukprot:CAMPEP_0172523930 /NCGR_PEP_ID=MMETSP1066-20121228/293918_1 /TAXON_ID=671091 /ORGANISM="Coscinodiscus wailesii, Strain CCMP2513" /LENGTH=897 /DNA_ID=CAMNT_0013307029 /DNA_START=125 /DNA_END=2819 /DNA_ORIENTATION=+